LSLFAKMRRFEKSLVAEDDLRSPVQRFLVLASRKTATRADLTALLSKYADVDLWQHRLERVRRRLGMFRMGA
jgi:hypothetical protein